MRTRSGGNPFNDLQTVGLEETLLWLRGLPQPTKRVIVHGCSSSEPLALFLHLEAEQVFVVEINRNQFYDSFGCSPVDELALMCKKHPHQFNISSVQFIVGDLLSSPLMDSSFDLAFCKNVLYFIEDDTTLENAVSEMARLVRPRGYIIAVEPKVGRKHHIVDCMLGPVAIANGVAKDICYIFEDIGLVKIQVPSAPIQSYCYQKGEENLSA